MKIIKLKRIVALFMLLTISIFSNSITAFAKENTSTGVSYQENWLNDSKIQAEMKTAFSEENLNKVLSKINLQEDGEQIIPVSQNFYIRCALISNDVPAGNLYANSTMFFFDFV